MMTVAPELLSPAGSRESFLAALANGADAIYLGSGRLNARGDKAQFSEEDLADLIRLAHEKKVKVYLTLNILLYDEELAEALALARFAFEQGIDACIVQDRGLMRVLHRELPDLVLHASTQCTAGTKEAIAAYRALGCRRVVLPRELSVDEIAALTSYAHSLSVETEIFIHGALCMSVSGQCHMSHFMGGRSANRGDCAQSCRKTYKILRNGAVFRKEGAWLSPKDLGAFAIFDRLLATGADSFKIEGRLRSAAYTAQVTGTYRKAMDDYLAGVAGAAVAEEAASPGAAGMSGVSVAGTEEREQARASERERDLLLAFNRGGDFTRHFWEGKRDKSFLSGDVTSHQGLFLGDVSDVLADQGVVHLFRSGDLPSSYLPLEGSQITLRTVEGEDLATAPCGSIEQAKDPRIISLKGFHPKVLRKLRLPIQVWQMGQPTLRELPVPKDTRSSLAIRLRREGEHFYLRFSADGLAREYSDEILVPAPSVLEQAILPARCEEQLTKLGQTPFRTGAVEIVASPPWRISDLNRFRREALALFLADCEKSAGSVAVAVEDVGAGSVFDEDAGSVVGAATDSIVRKDFSLIMAWPFWRVGQAIPAVLRKTDGLLLLPAGDLVQLSEAEFIALLASLGEKTKVGAILPPEQIAEVNDFLEEKLKRFGDLGLAALAQGPSGLPAWVRRLGLLDLALLSWQGGQLWNLETAEALAKEGYTHALISPELKEWKTAALAKEMASKEGMKPLVWAYGRTQAMFTRFCPVGFSKGKESCTLCVEAAFSFEDERGRIFPLRPQRELACAFEVWQAEALRSEAWASAGQVGQMGSRLGGQFGGRRFGAASATPVFVFTDESEEMMEALLGPYVTGRG